jgi:hypothetical protein
VPSKGSRTTTAILRPIIRADAPGVSTSDLRRLSGQSWQALENRLVALSLHWPIYDLPDSTWHWLRITVRRQR